jgi:hypothetical protein
MDALGSPTDVVCPKLEEATHPTVEYQKAVVKSCRLYKASEQDAFSAHRSVRLSGSAMEAEQSFTQKLFNNLYHLLNQSVNSYSTCAIGAVEIETSQHSAVGTTCKPYH